MASARRSKGLGRVVALLLDEQGSMVVEGDRDVGVVVAEQLLLDLERASIERVGASWVAGAVVDRGEVVERDRDLVVVAAELSLEHCQRVQEERLRLLVATEAVEDGGDCGAVGRNVDVLGPRVGSPPRL